jgi:hypothetical protein
VVDKAEMEQAYSHPLLIIIPHLHTYLLLSPDKCYNLDQTAYYQMHHLLVWSFMSGPALGWSQTKKFVFFLNKESAIFTFAYKLQCHIQAKDLDGFGVI